MLSAGSVLGQGAVPGKRCAIHLGGGQLCDAPAALTLEQTGVWLCLRHATEIGCPPGAVGTRSALGLPVAQENCCA